MQEITIKIKCNSCEEYAEDDGSSKAPGWYVDWPVTFGTDRVLVDLCPQCFGNLYEVLVEQGRSVAKAPRRRTATGRPRSKNLQPGTFFCGVKGCGQQFSTEHGLGMHRKRSHGLDYYQKTKVT